MNAIELILAIHRPDTGFVILAVYIIYVRCLQVWDKRDFEKRISALENPYVTPGYFTGPAKKAGR